MGQYSYPCYGYATCTGYLKASDDVEFGASGGWFVNGNHQYIKIYGSWGVNKGRIVDWTGGDQQWAGLPYK